ncbi:CDP-alcohol phosphatidyltransferase family protein [Cellulomonas sp. JH27-2]|uniref:CDP-alcohol phosphatidyltransferase family protein n=1 Tax=Cellulomonas sp. JH27-2 TaxID=2774139 RepID=UPI00177E79AF|nr:CDP-alcohol phosphatidyltransferase family protein [Cellulomonas sp. JH27-2]MBD8059603.1 CDP-alcohol phosphatidyltransferase family protein [Cellulomonas sp. JH27-2]
MSESYMDVVRELAGAQKGAARGAPAYSRFVNRRLGRFAAAWALRRGLTPNAVTGLSALATFAGIGMLAFVAPAWWEGIAVAALLVLGYALDSADGQVARATRSGSAQGEWLDHMVDATKIATLPLAVGVGIYRFTDLDDRWLLIPLVNAVVGSVLFFGMILTEQLRRAHGVTSSAVPGAAGGLRSLLVLPTDYGILCLTFVFWGSPTTFLTIFGFLTAATAGYLVLAARKWFVEIGAFARG